MLPYFQKTQCWKSKGTKGLLLGYIVHSNDSCCSDVGDDTLCASSLRPQKRLMHNIYKSVVPYYATTVCVCVCVCVKVCVLSQTPLSQHLCLAIYSCLQLNCAFHSSYYSVRQNVKAPVAMDDKHRNRASSQQIVRHTHTHTLINYIWQCLNPNKIF